MFGCYKSRGVRLLKSSEIIYVAHSKTSRLCGSSKIMQVAHSKTLRLCLIDVNRDGHCNLKKILV